MFCLSVRLLAAFLDSSSPFLIRGAPQTLFFFYSGAGCLSLLSVRKFQLLPPPTPPLPCSFHTLAVLLLIHQQEEKENFSHKLSSFTDFSFLH